MEAQAADSQVLQRKAELEQAQLNLSYTIVRSPVTGIVGRRRLEVGKSVSVGQDLIDIVSLADLWITTGNHVKTSQRVHVRIDFDRPEGQDFNAEGTLKPGLSAESEVRVRWLPRVRAPITSPGSRGRVPPAGAL